MSKREVISKCPICGKDLTIARLHCDHCNVEINGEFKLSKLCGLNKEQLTFVEMFLKNQGSIKAVEKEMGSSYPTIKKILNEILAELGYDVADATDTKNVEKRQEILDKLARKELSFDEANAQLRTLK